MGLYPHPHGLVPSNLESQLRSPQCSGDARDSLGALSGTRDFVYVGSLAGEDAWRYLRELIWATRALLVSWQMHGISGDE